VLAKVYLLRHKGVPIDPARVRRSPPHRGDLALRVRLQDHRNCVLLAQLLLGDAYLLPPLDQARVVEIRGYWIHIEGLEVHQRGRKGDGQRYPQEWWCRVLNSVDDNKPPGP
jgi:hypothetical protein